MKKSYQFGGSAPIPNCCFSNPTFIRAVSSVGFGDEVDTQALINQGVDQGVKYADAAMKKSGGDVKKLEAAGAAALAGGASGAAIGTMVFPGIGTAVGAIIGAFISIVGVLTEAPYCNVTGLHGQKYECKDFINNYINAANWVKQNPTQAANMKPSDLSDQFDVPTDNTGMKSYADITRQFSPNAPFLGALDALAKMPGTIEMLRAVQLPMASAWAAVHTKTLNAIPDIGSQFPALTHDDLQQIIAKVTPLISKRPTSLVPKRKALPPKPLFNTSNKKLIPAVIRSTVNPHIIAPNPAIKKSHPLWHKFLQFLHLEKRVQK